MTLRLAVLLAACSLAAPAFADEMEDAAAQAASRFDLGTIRPAAPSAGGMAGGERQVCPAAGARGQAARPGKRRLTPPPPAYRPPQGSTRSAGRRGALLGSAGVLLFFGGLGLLLVGSTAAATAGTIAVVGGMFLTLAGTAALILDPLEAEP